MTTTSTAAVRTDRAARYGKQLVSHLGRRSIGGWDTSTESGTLEMTPAESALPAHVTFRSTPEALLIELTAAESDLGMFEDVVGRHLVRFGSNDELRVDWQRADGTPGSSQH